MHNNLSFFPAGNACGRLYGFEIEFDVTPQEAQPLLDALDVAIERSRTYENVVYFGVCSKFKAVSGYSPCLISIPAPSTTIQASPDHP